ESEQARLPRGRALPALQSVLHGFEYRPARPENTPASTTPNPKWAVPIRDRGTRGRLPSTGPQQGPAAPYQGSVRWRWNAAPPEAPLPAPIGSALRAQALHQTR